MGHRLSDAASHARRLAEAAFEHRDDARGALQLATIARRVAGRSGDDAAAAIADRTTARALFELGESARGLRMARRAVAEADLAGDAEVLAGALITLGGGLSLCGRPQESLDILDRAVGLASAADAIDARAQRAVALHSVGRRREALDELVALLEPTSAVHPDPRQRADVLHDLGVVQAFLSRFADAERSFSQAADAFERLGQAAAAFDARRNLALSYVQAGRLPAALRLFDELTQQCGADVQRAVWLGCVHMEAMLSANLHAEALAVAERLVVEAQAASPDLRAEAWRLCADAFGVLGDHRRAAEVARRAERLFRNQGFVPLAAVARRHAAAGLAPRRRVTALGEIIKELSDAGLPAEVVATRLLRMEVAIGIGANDLVALDRAALDSARRHHATAMTRMQCWLGEALAAESVADLPAAERASRAGLAVLDEYRATLGATELRAHASLLGERLADVGLRVARAARDAARVFAAAERWRAGTVLAAPATSARLDEAIAELRGLLAQHDEALGGEVDAGIVNRRQLAAEQRVRGLARSLDGDRSPRPTVASPRAVRAALGERVLVEYVEHAGSYVAVISEPGRRMRLVDVATTSAITGEVDDLGFALRRLARRGIAETAAQAAMRSAGAALDALDRALLAPLELTGEKLVIVPPASLHTVPFPSLATARRCEVVVAPSASWWCDAVGSARDGVPSDRDALIAGPRLPGADHEVHVLAAQWQSATTLTGDSATVSAAALALDGARLAHLACHGHRRADHPHLSSLELVDGPFTIYDFERLGRPPRQVVLAACDSAVGAARPGDELLGFLTALLGLGTRDVLASVVPVPDLATTDFMVRFHRELEKDGCFPAALTRTSSSLDTTDPANFAASVAFVAFGVGATPA